MLVQVDNREYYGGYRKNPHYFLLNFSVKLKLLYEKVYSFWFLVFFLTSNVMPVLGMSLKKT